MKPAAKASVSIAVLALAVALGSGIATWLWHEAQASKAADQVRHANELAAAEKASPRNQQRDLVRLHLNDPDSAQFRNDQPSKRRPESWCGEVNARNRMGGFVGFTRYVTWMQKDRQRAEGDEVWLAPTSASPSETAVFESKWRAFCE